MPKFTIQMELKVVVSREITADSFEAAVAIGKEFATYDGHEYVRTKTKNWSIEYGLDSKLIGVQA